jgi:double zinc ribbon protein
VTVALIVGTLLAVSALAFVLYPIFFGDPHAATRPAGAGDRARAARDASRSALDDSTSQESAVAALREIEFDRATGKLSETDYGELKAQYTRQAILAMRQQDSADSPSAGAIHLEDEIEAAVRAYRAQHLTCPTCGPRPESDAAFCSTCGRYLHDRCADCGAPVVALDARYCMSCGNRLAA